MTLVTYGLKLARSGFIQDSSLQTLNISSQSKKKGGDWGRELWNNIIYCYHAFISFFLSTEMRKDDVLLSTEGDRNIATAICQNQDGVDDKIVRKESRDREGSGRSCDILRVIYLGAVLSVSHTTRQIICSLQDAYFNVPTLRIRRQTSCRLSQRSNLFKFQNWTFRVPFNISNYRQIK